MAAKDDQRHEDLNEISTLDGDLRIGDFLVRPLLKQVVRIGEDGVVAEENSLPDKAMGVLVYLAENARQVCERDDILDAVWGEDRDVYDRVLDNAVAEIRRVFGDDAREPSYVQTVPRVGYRSLQLGHVPTHTLPSPDPRLATPLTRSAAAERAASRTRVLGWILLVASVLALARFISLFGAREPKGPSVQVLLSTPDTLVDRSLISRNEIEIALYDTHPCGDTNLLKPQSRLSRHDLKITLSQTQDSARTTASARIQRFQGQTVEFARTEAHKSTQHQALDQLIVDSKRFAKEVRLASDRLICDAPSPFRKERACHCLASAETPVSGSNRPAEMIRRLELATQLDPNLIAAYSALSAAYYRMAERESAIAVLQEGLSRVQDPDSLTGLELRLSLAKALNDYKYARTLAENLVIRQPKDLNHKVELARILADHFAMCEESLGIFNSIEARTSQDPALQIGKALSLFRCQRLNEAIKLLESGLARSPRNSEMLVSLIPMLERVGRLDEAKNHAQRLLALKPDSSVSYWYLAGLTTSAGRYDEAESWLKKAQRIQAWPIDQAYILQFEAYIADNRRDYETCASKWKLANSYVRAPRLVLRFGEGLCLLKAGRHEEVDALIKEAEITFNHVQGPDGQWMISMLRTMLKSATTELDLDSTISNITEATAQSGNDLNATFSAGEFLVEKAPAAAESLYQRALERNPRHPWSYCRLGLISLHQGQSKRAITHLREAIEIFGNPPEDPLGMECAQALAELDPTFTIAN